MHRIVQSYGKQLTKELLDYIIISGKIDNKIAYEILRKHKIINGRTKEVYVRCAKSLYGGGHWSLSISSRSRQLVIMAFYEIEIPTILEACKDETNRDNE